MHLNYHTFTTIALKEFRKAIKLAPEEAIRQLYLRVLTERLHYPLSRIQVEYGVNFGREVKRADIVVMDKDRPNTVYLLVEVKKPKLKDGKNQLRSYCNATGAPIAVWTNGEQISYYQRKDPNYFEDIPGLPVVNSKHVREGKVILTDNRYAYLPETNNPLTIQTDDILIS